MNFSSPGIVSQIQRYGAVLGALGALLLLLMGIVRLLNYYQRRRNLMAGPTANQDLRPVGDRGLLVDAKAARGAGFSPEEMLELGVSWKFHPAAQEQGSGDDDSGDDEQCDGNSVVGGEGEAGGWRKECIICLGEYQEGELLRKLGLCGHFFHQDCVDAWLLAHRSCPFCRAALSSNSSADSDSVDAAGGQDSHENSSDPARQIPEEEESSSDQAPGNTAHSRREEDEEEPMRRGEEAIIVVPDADGDTGDVTSNSGALTHAHCIVEVSASR